MEGSSIDFIDLTGHDDDHDIPFVGDRKLFGDHDHEKDPCSNHMSIDLTAEDSQQDDKCDLDFTHLGTQRSGYGNVQSSAHPPRELEVMIKATKKELEEVRCEVQSLKDKVEYFNNQLLWGRWSQSPGIPSDESSGFCLDRNEACNSLSHHCEEVVFHPDIILCRPIRSGREVNPYSVDSSPTQGKFIYFGKLPASIQAAIFRLWLHINGRTIHCFSRLGHLDHAHERPRKTSHARHRHYWGHAKRVHFEEDTEDPQDLLRILLVSNLEEFASFASGIGPVRRASLRHLELTWNGEGQSASQVIEEPAQEIPEETGYTHPLKWLMELPLLRTLVFFVTESHPGSMGFIDKSASVGIVSNTMGRTKTPKYRDLRTLEGIEYIYALRGLESVQFYDLRPTAQLGRRFGVRDSLFVDAVNNVVTMTRQSAECPGHWHSQIAKEESETDGPAVSVEPQDRTTWLVENAWNHVYRLYKNSHLRTRPDADPIGPGNLNTSYQNTDGNQEDPIIKNQLRDLPVVASIFQNIGRNVHNEDVALRSSCSHPGADAPVTDERKVYSDTTPSALSQRAVQNLATGLYNCPTDSSHSTHSHTSASDDHLRDFAELLRESSQPLANPGAVTDCHGRERSTSGDSLFVAGPLSISLLGQGNDGE